MVARRLLVAAVALPVVLCVAYLGGWPLIALALVAALLGIAELRVLFEHAQFPVSWPLAFLAAPLLILDAALPDLGLRWIAIVGLVIGGLVWALFQDVEPRRAVLGWLATLAAPLYLGVPLNLALLLRSWGEGRGPALALGPLSLTSGALWLILALALPWVCDSVAFAVGRRFGRRPLLARVSPRKTVEGTVAGVAAAGVVGAVVGLPIGLAPGVGLGIGLAGGVAAVFGDLAESLLKRAGGAKDSGILFPGHGGMLDRLDSLLFVFVVVYYCGEFARSLGA